jgi:2-C-methyl-D-erythritol 2,4-cyclodiphosphate synthase
VAHSDGDVLLHALTDALLGAVGAGDIGEHFPDSDARWKDCPSSRFLEGAAAVVEKRGFSLVQVDATVFLEKVKLSPLKRGIAEKIRELLADFWPLEAGCVNIKAKTMESCDAVGSGEAIAAQVIVLVEKHGE